MSEECKEGFCPVKKAEEKTTKEPKEPIKTRLGVVGESSFGSF